jgi:phospholipase/carboxylesterase
VDPQRMMIAGFSDGASYALSLGLVNGDAWRRTAAFSPGFIVPAEWHGSPTFFVSHGRSDNILPIDVAGRRVVTMLQRGGYRVRYREFDGGHTIPPEIREEGVNFLLER